MADSDDDAFTPTLTPELLALLSPEARAALQEVMAEKALDATGEAPGLKESPAGVSENWNLSQFWYSKTTSDLLAREMLNAVQSSGVKGPIACLSCPSTYNALRAIVPSSQELILFEYDKRFERTAEKFVFYDFKDPSQVPPELLGACAGVVLDPPYLNVDCLKAFTTSVMMLASSSLTPLMLCTGSVMCNHARRLLGVRPTNAVIEHEGNRLSNPFACFVNFRDATGLGGWNVGLEAAEAAAVETSGGDSDQK